MKSKNPLNDRRVVRPTSEMRVRVTEVLRPIQGSNALNDKAVDVKRRIEIEQSTRMMDAQSVSSVVNNNFDSLVKQVNILADQTVLIDRRFVETDKITNEKIAYAVSLASQEVNGLREEIVSKIDFLQEGYDLLADRVDFHDDQFDKVRRDVNLFKLNLKEFELENRDKFSGFEKQLKDQKKLLEDQKKKKDEDGNSWLSKALYGAAGAAALAGGALAKRAIKSGAKVAGKGAKIIGKASAAAIAASAAKIAPKWFGKMGLKKIPLIGLGVGLYLAVEKAAQGDLAGATMEASSGALGTIPGVGTAASLAIDVGSLAREVYYDVYETYPEADPLASERFPELIAAVNDEAQKQRKEATPTARPHVYNRGGKGSYLGAQVFGEDDGKKNDAEIKNVEIKATGDYIINASKNIRLESNDTVHLKGRKIVLEAPEIVMLSSSIKSQGSVISTKNLSTPPSSGAPSGSRLSSKHEGFELPGWASDRLNSMGNSGDGSGYSGGGGGYSDYDSGSSSSSSTSSTPSGSVSAEGMWSNLGTTLINSENPKSVGQQGSGVRPSSSPDMMKLGGGDILFGGSKDNNVQFRTDHLPGYATQPVGREYDLIYDSQASGNQPRGYEYGKNGAITKDSLYYNILDKIKGSSLNGFTPKDGKRYGIDGSPESWANYLTQLANAESSYRPKLGNTTAAERAISAGAGSHGLFQLSPEDARNYGIKKGKFSMEELHDPDTNIDAAIKIHEHWMKKNGSIRYGAGKYWGPIKRGRAIGSQQWEYGAAPEGFSNSGSQGAPGSQSGPTMTAEDFANIDPQRPSQKIDTGGMPVDLGDGIGSLKNERRRESTSTPDMFRVNGKSPFNYGISQEARAEFGKLGTNLTTITINNGKKLTVNKAVAEDMKGFLNEALARGYDIKDLGGYAFRNNRNNPSKWSTHASGGTVDLNPGRNPNKSTHTDMPEGMKKLAMKWGFAQLGYDKMHFERVHPKFRKEYLRRLIADGTLKKDDPFVKKRIQEGMISQDDVNGIDAPHNPAVAPKASEVPIGEPNIPIEQRGIAAWSGAKDAKDAATQGPDDSLKDIGPQGEIPMQQVTPDADVPPGMTPETSLAPPVAPPGLGNGTSIIGSGGPVAPPNLGAGNSIINSGVPAPADNIATVPETPAPETLQPVGPETEVAQVPLEGPSSSPSDGKGSESASVHDGDKQEQAANIKVPRNNRGDSVPHMPGSEGTGSYSNCIL